MTDSRNYQSIADVRAEISETEDSRRKGKRVALFLTLLTMWNAGFCAFAAVETVVGLVSGWSWLLTALDVVCFALNAFCLWINVPRLMQVKGLLRAEAVVLEMLNGLAKVLDLAEVLESIPAEPEDEKPW